MSMEDFGVWRIFVRLIIPAYNPKGNIGIHDYSDILRESDHAMAVAPIIIVK